MPIRTGVDLTDLARVERVLEQHGDHFKQRFFPQYEAKHDNTSDIPSHTYAGLWAAKEAVFKALGRGYRWESVFIDHESTGRPVVRIDAEAARLHETPIPEHASWDCSISHDERLAIAFAACYWED